MIDAEALTTFSAELLRAGGFSAEYARETAELLVWANLRGAASHGVLRIPRYIEMVEQGLVRGDARPAIRHEFGAIAVYDGDLVPGASGLRLTADKAAALARQFGIGICSIVRTSHAGAIGYFAERLTRQGQCAIVMTASKPLMVYHGARRESVSTNPLAIGAPTDNPDRPIILDMSTASVALGKIMAAKDAGRTIPLDWGVDANGAPTSDPAKVKAVLPMAGPKGSGMSLMIEILVSLLGGNPLISPALSEATDNGFNGAVIAISPHAFGPEAKFAEHVIALQNSITNLEPAEGVDRVLLPGERGYEVAISARKKGIVINSGTRDRLIGEAVKLGVQLPGAFV